METLTDESWWWIDYLEDELDPSLDRDLQLLLEVSEEDRQAFEKFRLLREWVRESDQASDFNIDDKLAGLTLKVMQEVNRTQVPEDTKSLSF